ncbi:MAG: GNAT family N-acetyltransferase [bacterium]|nr:GNAT family N-acetyltransferase [bacterium]
MIRKFTEDDYAAYIAMYNTVHPSHPSTERGLRHNDKTREARLVRERWVWEEQGEMLGYMAFTTMSWMYHPRKFYCNMGVVPDHRGRGIGGALYDHMLQRLTPYDPLSVRSEILENRPETLAFAEKRGFVVGMREQVSKFELAKLDIEAYAGDLNRVVDEGIMILSYDELADDPDRHRKLYDLDYAASKDMPLPEPLTMPAFEKYCEQNFEHPNFSGSTFMVALDDDAYVGMSNLSKCAVKIRLETDFTGVLREYRGKGIATALKVRVLSRARELGYSEVRTSNDSTNESMLGINWRLGFVKEPAWLDHEKRFEGAVPDGEHKEDRKCEV